jgi:transposase
VWEQLLALIQERGAQLGMTFLDGTSIRAHQKAAGAARKGALQLSEMPVKPWAALGGYGTKACGIADGLGRAVAFIVAPGQAHELPHGIPLLDRLPGVPKWGVADRGYASPAFRQHVWNLGAQPAIPSKRNEVPESPPGRAALGPVEGVARDRPLLREDRLQLHACSFMGVLCLAAALDWLKS